MIADQPPDAVAAMLASDGASRALGIVVESYGSGAAVARMRVRPDMVNGHAIAHGGLIFTLADTAFAAACNSVAAPTVAASAEIVFIAAARLGEELVATAQLRTSFGRNGIYDVTVSNDTAVIAEYRGRSHRLGP